MLWAWEGKRGWGGKYKENRSKILKNGHLLRILTNIGGGRWEQKGGLFLRKLKRTTKIDGN